MNVSSPGAACWPLLLVVVALGCERPTPESPAPTAVSTAVSAEANKERPLELSSPLEPSPSAPEADAELPAAVGGPVPVGPRIREDSVLAVAHERLGEAYLDQSAHDRAIAHYEKACATAPEDDRLRLAYGMALLQAGRVREGQEQLERLLKTDSMALHAANNLAWSLATDPDEAHRDGKRAVELAMRVCERTDASPQQWDTLAAALAENNEFERAKSAAAEGIRRAVSLGEPAMAASIHTRLAGYNTGLPHRDSREPPEEAVSPHTVHEHPQVLEHFIESPEDRQRMPQMLWVARVLATHADPQVRDGRLALRIAQRVNELTKGADPTCLLVLAAAQAAQERWVEAAETAHAAQNLFIKANLDDLAREAADHAALYFTAKPLIEYQGDAFEAPRPNVNNPLRRVAHAYWLVAKHFADLDMPQEAIVACSAGIEFDATYARGHVLLARLLLDQLRPAEARLPLLTAEALGCDTAEYYEQRARLAMAYVDIDEGERFYRQAIDSAADDWRLRAEFIWFQATRPDKPVAAGEEAVRLAEEMVQQTGSPTVRQLEVLSAAYAAAERFDDAIDAVHRAAKLAREQGIEAKASSLSMRAELFELQERFTTEAAALARIGLERISEREFETAISLLLRSLDLRPGHIPTIFNLGTAYMGAGKIHEAVKLFRLAIQRNPKSPQAFNNLAWLLATQELGNYFDPRGAVLLAKRSIELEGTPRPETLDTLALAYAASNEFDKAQSIAARAAQLANEAGNKELAAEIEDRATLYSLKIRYTTPLDAHSRLARHTLDLGQAEEAKWHFEAAVRLDPQDAKLWAELGAAQIKLNQVHSAVAALRKSLGINPNQVDAANNLAWLIATGQVNGDPQEAVILSEQASESTGNANAMFLDTLAASYAAAGRFRDAVRIADKALKVAKIRTDGEPNRSIELRRSLYLGGQPYRILRELGPINAKPEVSQAEFVSP